jgi:predicted MFS family arabinose efflux permease
MATVLAPFRVRSFRFQWPADLVTSWAIEMENLILGWYVLSSTGSVEQLVAFGALVWLGSLFSPFFGIAGDRLGFRFLLCATRAAYAVLALILTALTWTKALEPWHIFTIAALAGLMRPQDNVMRYVLVGQTMRPELLLPALGIQRTTSDTARIAGALAGTGGVALVGMAPAYVVVTAMYVAAFLLSLGVAGPPPRSARDSAEAAASRAVAGLKQVVGYVWQRADQLGAFSVAFLVNLLAFPFFLGLLPYVAKEVYASGQSGLGYLAAAFSGGALCGSLVLGARRAPWRAGRVMLVAAAVWFAAILVFGQARSMALGIGLLLLSGFAQSLCMTPLAAVMLRSASDEMRGRVMGIRMLAIWGLPLGLLAAGPLIAHLGYRAATLLYAGAGLAATLAIAWRWRAALWDRAAPANSPV